MDTNQLVERIRRQCEAELKARELELEVKLEESRASLELYKLSFIMFKPILMALRSEECFVVLRGDKGITEA